LSSFENRGLGRSRTVIVVKNIPYNTIEEELHGMFSKFGTLGRVILPPARTIAMVEFLEETEAKAAFNALAYSKFKSLPLYLEWAPENAFKNTFEQFLAQKEEEKRKKTESTVTKEETEDGQASATLFVKNLNFNTTDSGFQNMFEALPGYRMAKISTKPDRSGQKRLSMGFGFVEFANPDQAQHAIKVMQGKYLDGHPLVLKMSNSRTKSRPVEAVSSKLVVRNVPFEASKKDLRQLFQ
jgi:multiple RNA-binding domain-containing protein 1